MKKKVITSLSLLLSSIMLVACGVPTLGGNVGKIDDSTPESLILESQTEEETIDFSSATVDSYITFGMKGDTPIEWKVLAIEDGKALIITKNCVDKRSYAGKVAVTWETCTLRSYLNGDFLDQTFSKAERAKIITTTVVNDDNPKYKTAGGNDTEDAIFLLSLEEVRKYFANEESRVATYGGKDYDWWLRSPGYNDLRAACVIYNGDVRESGGTFIDGNGVRPACWIRLK